jgi:hypothetical protein
MQEFLFSLFSPRACKNIFGIYEPILPSTQSPEATLFDGGMAFDGGTAFELTDSGGTWTETTLYFFDNNFDSCSDGCAPVAGLLNPQASAARFSN